MKKAFVLLSGGIDSTTCLHKALFDYRGDISIDRIHELIDRGAEDDHCGWVEGVSVFYGQRHKKEMLYAKRTCDRLGIRHTVLDVGSILSGAQVMLSAESEGIVEVPNLSYSDITGVSPTYVPFRNGTLLSAITAHAQKWVNEENKERVEVHLQEQDFKTEAEAQEHVQKSVSAGIYFGAHSEDALNWAYPDCTAEFIGAMANAIYIGTYHQVRLHTPIQWLDKKEVITLGNSMGVHWEDTWSCYKGEEQHCGVCPTCRSRREGFIAACVEDPTKYAGKP